MFTVALIGPDGAGKTTICRRLEQSSPKPAKYLYMGINLEVSNVVLPSTWCLLQVKHWLGGRPDMSVPRDIGPAKRSHRKGVRGLLAGIKSGLRMANQMAEEAFRQSIAWWYLRTGRVVLCDRDFFADFYASDVRGGEDAQAWPRRLHGWFLRRWYRRPNLVICLDAPADVLLNRKGEGTLEYLEQRRGEYQQLRHAVEQFVTVDVSQPADQVVREINDVICRFHDTRLSDQ